MIRTTVLITPFTLINVIFVNKGLTNEYLNVFYLSLKMSKHYLRVYMIDTGEIESYTFR